MKILIVVKLPKPAAKVIAIAQNIVDCMTANPLFPAPTPPLALVSADIDALRVANAAVLTRTKGTRQTRDFYLGRLRTTLRQLAAYVQSVSDGDVEHAAIIVASAGMDAKKESIRTIAPFRARAGLVPGSVLLSARRAHDRACYEWRYSTDQEHWSDSRRTISASIVIGGLAPETRYYFQLRVTLKDGVGEWGEPLSFLVT